MRTPRGHFLVVTAKLRGISRYEDLRAYVGAPEFLAGMRVLAEMRLADRLALLKVYTQAMGRCDETAPVAPAIPYERIVRWDESRIALLREVDARYGDDFVTARKLGVTITQARRARNRFCGPRTRPARTHSEVAYATAA